MDIEIKIPDLGIDEAEVIDILVCVNDTILKEQSLIVVEGEKTSMEIPAPCSGVIKEIKVNISDIVKKNSIIMIVENREHPEGNNNIINNGKKDIYTNENGFDFTHKTIHTSPLVRRMAHTLKIDLHTVVGTGRKSRITKQDIQNHIKNIDHSIHQDVASKEGIFDINDASIKDFDFSRFGKIETIELKKVKKISGDVLFKNWSTIPHVTQFDEVDITDLENFRKKYNMEVQNIQEKKITLLSFIIKALAKGLEKFPYFNSSISLDNKKIFLKKYINIGIAVDTTYGLVVPVVKDVKNKSIFDVSQNILYLSKKARERKLSVLDVQGGCFTISSLGGIGGTFFTPIINHPEAAILGVSKAFYKPIWNGNKFLPKLILPLSLSYNHRIIDGADGARFISFINKLLSDIRWLLL
ncbi:2-oxo acid dehydrogenase subunit E2 [Buchnera aphidicola]|uniref:2-oxo acid dehydrogenase subunit E2 n=1 Tax=Buchnera aphidicola TaxID=9 RepID=UPI003464143F